jgi:hypothetical protein
VTVMLPVMARRGVDLEVAVNKLRGQGINHVWIPDGSLVEWAHMAMSGSGIDRATAAPVPLVARSSPGS